jgi:hypothetical protein
MRWEFHMYCMKREMKFALALLGVFLKKRFNARMACSLSCL